MPGGAIAVASDHAGFDLKEILKRDLQEAGHVVLDLGTNLRLVTAVAYTVRIVEARFVGTHRQYDAIEAGRI